MSFKKTKFYSFFKNLQISTNLLKLRVTTLTTATAYDKGGRTQILPELAEAFIYVEYKKNLNFY